MDNAFLASFLKARAALANDVASSKSKTTPDKPRKITMTMASIIEECPPKSKVLEYLRKRIEEMEDDDFAD